MLTKMIDWLIYIFKELAKVGDWLFTPITWYNAEQAGISDFNTDGVILESSSASVKVFNFFVRLFTNNWDFTTDPGSITIIPAYVIGATFIGAIFIAMFVKVWIRR